MNDLVGAGVHEGTKGAVEQDAPSYGLRQGVLSPMEVLAQSISTIAPSTSPTLTVPLVFGLAGVGTCWAYGIAMGAMVLVALCVAVFARDSASPGSLYVYVRETMPAGCAAVTAFAVFFAYVMIAASCVGGFVNYVDVLMGTRVPGVVWGAVVCACAVLVAYRDVKISARVMLWVEGVSVGLIAVVVALTLWRNGLHVDWAQVKLTGVSVSQVRLGVVLAMFSFVGFESATTLGEEAREPLRTIPRAVVLSALLVGVFLLVCSYGEVLGFRGAPQGLGESTAPFRYLAGRAGVQPVGLVIDVGVLIAMFAAVLGCVVAAARVLMLMGYAGLAPAGMQRTHARFRSPVRASVVSGMLVFVPPAVCLLRGVSGADVYGYLGTLAVFGFLTAYALVGVAMVMYLKRRARLSMGAVVLACAAVLAMAGAAVGTMVPVPAGPYKWFPLVYAGYLVVGVGWYWVRRKRGIREKG